jgi:hypothetical protein
MNRTYQFVLIVCRMEGVGVYGDGNQLHRVYGRGSPR